MSTEAGSPLSKLEAARLHIVHLKLEDSENLWRAVATALRVSAKTLGVARVGLWFLSADRLALHQIVVHDERLPDEDDEGRWTLALERWPAYFAAITSRRIVAADDAQSDPRTTELRDDYLSGLGITSMMDAPVFLSGEVWGVVCHEHVGAMRTWSAREIDFAVSVADMLTALLEQSTRIHAQKQLRAEEQMAARARQAEALVRTIAGIGHDFNTVLQAVSSSAGQAIRGTDEHERRAAMNEIVDSCSQGARIVEQLRELGKPSEKITGALDLSFVIADLRKMLEGMLAPAHALVTELAPGALVAATRADLERILMNLVLNAREAMPGGGTVTVIVQTSPDTVVLMVRDHGVGIDKAAADQIFEPYFTTKTERSSGLGLFAVQTIASRTAGTISVTSAEGRGTDIVITWPRARDE